MDFWKTIEPYVWNWAGEDLKDFWIIRVMKEVETVREVANYRSGDEGTLIYSQEDVGVY